MTALRKLGHPYSDIEISEAPAALAGVSVKGESIRMTLAPASWNLINLVPA